MTDLSTDYEPDNTQNQGSDGSSKLQEFARLEEYLSLKLPPVVRRELKKVIDEAFAPIEGALANQFETIVRGCQESASRAFFDNLQPTSYLFTLSTAAKSQNYECANMTGGVHMGCPPDGLAPYDMPADSALEGSPQLGYAIPGVSSK